MERMRERERERERERAIALSCWCHFEGFEEQCEFTGQVKLDGFYLENTASFRSLRQREISAVFFFFFVSVKKL